jgi:hypothetical protein
MTGDPAKDYCFLWVTNFPMFEYDEAKSADGSASSIHPPHEEDGQTRIDPAMVRALHMMSCSTALSWDQGRSVFIARTQSQIFSASA